MKKIIKFISLVFCLLLVSSCFKVDYKETLEKMSLIELNQYYKELLKENEELEKSYLDLVGISDGKSKEELIEIINYLNNEVIKSNVMITNESKGLFHTTSVSSGSGTIIDEDESYYYVLTNNHVIYSLGYKTSYYVYDYLNHEYNGTLLFNDARYDMALLRFNKKSTSLRVMNIASEDSLIGDNIITIGQPLGQRNAITFGEVIKYEIVNCENCNTNQSNIQYECMYYDARTTNGNSGGMIIDYNYNLVGVVTFGMTSSDGKYMSGAGSPASKVKEFLIKAGERNA